MSAAPPTERRIGAPGLTGALAFGALSAFAATNWPVLTTQASGLDAPEPAATLVALGLLLAGFVFGLAARRARRALLVAGLGCALGSVVVAGARALSIAQVGDLESAWLMALLTGIAFGVLVAGIRGAGRWLLLPATVAAAAALAVFAADQFGGNPGSAAMRAAAVVLAPPVILFAVALGRPAPTRPGWAPLPMLAVAAAMYWLSLSIVPVPPLPTTGVDGPRYTELARHGTATAIYDRRTQEMQLWDRGELVDGEGPDRPQSALLATVLAALSRPGDRVLVLGEGTGRLPPALRRAGIRTVDVVSWRTAARPLLGRLGDAGPVADPRVADSGAGALARGCLRALASLPAGARQAIVVAEPLHAGSDWQCQIANQAELRRVAGPGLVVQPFALDRAPTDRLLSLLVAAGQAHGWNGVLAVGDCGLLLSAAVAVEWPREGAFARWSDAARWQAHEAHLGDGPDLQRAWLGTVIPGSGEAPRSMTLAAAAAGPRAVSRVLHASLEPAPVRPPSNSSLLDWWVDVRSRLRAVERSLQAAADSPEDRERLRQATIPFLPMGSPSALLQAALALPDPAGVRFASPELATLAAFAIDPMQYGERPPLLAELPKPKRRSGDLEDLAGLPPDDRLLELCSDTSTLAIALRVRFPSDCARVLVAALAEAPLSPPRQQVLRQLADPLVLELAGRALRGRDAVGELLGLWRGDLAMPVPLATMLRAGSADRIALAAALAGRKDTGSLHALADLLLDETLDVRAAAAGSLAVTARGRIEYEPKWPRSKRFLAAERVRALHNRAP